MYMSYFKQGFASGLNVRGVPLVQTHPGQVFWVSNAATTTAALPVNGVTGSDNAGSGCGTFHKPFKTLAYALTQCATGRGDIIFLKSGHAETVSSATALGFSVANVAIVGLGVGAYRPKLTLDTANTATIAVSANCVTVMGVRFVANFLAIAACFTLTTATDFQLVDCEFLDTSSSLNFIAIVVTDATSNHADGLVIDTCKFLLLATSGAVKLVNFAGTNDRVHINNNFYRSPTTNAGAVMPILTTKILTNFRLTGNTFLLVNAAGTATGVLLTTDGSTNTGVLDGNKAWGATTSPILVTASSGFVYAGNLWADAADLQGYPVPAADL